MYQQYAPLLVSCWATDHEPAHVHVLGDREAKINLVGPKGRPELIWADGMKRNEVRRAMALVAGHRTEFLAQLRKIHG